jgi:hypothetical protein
MQYSLHFFIFAIVTTISCSFHILHPKSIRSIHMKSLPDLNAEILKSPLEKYANYWVDTYHSLGLSVPEPIIHWGHAASMTTVLLLMGGLGTFLGLQIRQGNGAAQYAFTVGKTAREQHPIIMGLAFLFFVLGGQGGLVLLALEGKPILESPHASTALIGLSLLSLQVFYF